MWWGRPAVGSASMILERYEASPVSRPCHIGEFALSASSVGRWRSSRSQSWIALSPESTPTCTCRPKQTRRRLISRITSASQAYRSPGLYRCSYHGLKACVPLQTSCSPRSETTSLAQSSFSVRSRSTSLTVRQMPVLISQ